MAVVLQIVSRLEIKRLAIPRRIESLRDRLAIDRHGEQVIGLGNREGDQIARLQSANDRKALGSGSQALLETGKHVSIRPPQDQCFRTDGMTMDLRKNDSTGSRLLKDFHSGRH